MRESSFKEKKIIAMNRKKQYRAKVKRIANGQDYKEVCNFITHNHAEALPQGLIQRADKLKAVNDLMREFLNGNGLPVCNAGTDAAVIHNTKSVKLHFNQFKTWLNTIY